MPRTDTSRPKNTARAVVRLEPLEGRALLSHVSPRLTSVPAEVQGVRLPRSPHPGPILNEIGRGYAVKSPRFYEFYTGPKRGELNAAGARAYLDGRGNLQLVGIVAGQVNPRPTRTDQEAFYVWGIDRGLAKFPGPFPGRPRITFDSVVVVSVQQSGVTGVVQDLTTGKVTPLSPSAITLDAYDVKVAVPLAPFTTAGTPTTLPKVNFWTRNTPAPADYHAVASFAPDGRDFPVGVAR